MATQQQLIEQLAANPEIQSISLKGEGGTEADALGKTVSAFQYQILVEQEGFTVIKQNIEMLVVQDGGTESAFWARRPGSSSYSAYEESVAKHVHEKYQPKFALEMNSNTSRKYAILLLFILDDATGKLNQTQIGVWSPSPGIIESAELSEKFVPQI